MNPLQPDTLTHQLHQKALCQLLEEFDRVCKTLSIPYMLFAGTLLGAVRHDGFIPWDDDLDVIMLRKDYTRFLQEAPSVLNTETYFLQKEFSEHWPMFFSKLRLNNTTCLEKFHPKDPAVHQGIYIDIFPCDNAYDTLLGRKLQFLCSKVVIAKCLYRRGYDTDSAKKKLFMHLCRALPMKPFLHLTQAKGKAGSTVHSFLGAASCYEKNVYPRQYFQELTTHTFENKMYPIPANHHQLLQLLYGDYMVLPPLEQRQCKQHAIVVDLEHSWEKYAHIRDDMKFEVYTRSIR